MIGSKHRIARIGGRRARRLRASRRRIGAGCGCRILGAPGPVAAVADPTALCEPARWIGKGEPAAAVTKVAEQQDTGWWVVLATVPADQDVQAIVRQMEGCGLRPFNDFSGKFARLQAWLPSGGRWRLCNPVRSRKRQVGGLALRA